MDASDFTVDYINNSGTSSTYMMPTLVTSLDVSESEVLLTVMDDKSKKSDVPCGINF